MSTFLHGPLLCHSSPILYVPLPHHTSKAHTSTHTYARTQTHQFFTLRILAFSFAHTLSCTLFRAYSFTPSFAHALLRTLFYAHSFAHTRTNSLPCAFWPSLFCAASMCPTPSQPAWTPCFYDLPPSDSSGPPGQA